MERSTFARPGGRRRAQGLPAAAGRRDGLRQPTISQLMKRFSVIGPPTTAFFASDGPRAARLPAGRVSSTQPRSGPTCSRSNSTRAVATARYAGSAYGLVALGAAVTGAYVHERLTPRRYRRPCRLPCTSLEAAPKAAMPRPACPRCDPISPSRMPADTPASDQRMGRQAADDQLLGRAGARPAGARSRCSTHWQAEPALKDLQIVGIAVDFPQDVQTS